MQRIEQSLRQRFAAPVKEFYKRRIIFWRDPEGEFAELVNEIRIEGVKVLKLTGTNNFYAKMLLCEIDPESNYLVYDPLSYENVKDNWLTDVECYSEEFRADLISIRMSALGIPDTPQTRTVMRTCARFFDNKERVARLSLFGGEYLSAGQLKVDIMAVLCDTQNNTPYGVIRAFLASGRRDGENRALENLRKFGSEQDLWELIGRFTGFERGEQEPLPALADHLLLTALSLNASEGMMRGFEQQISKAHARHCYAVVGEWMHAEEQTFYEVAREVERRLMLADRFDRCELSELVSCECFPCINECILRRLMGEISEGVIKAEEMIEIVEKRRAMKWYEGVCRYFEGILQVARMQSFYTAHLSGFHVGSHEELWTGYLEEYHKMDLWYRLFHTAFGKSLRDTATSLDDLYKSVADYVENLYKNWYLSELGGQWTALIGNEVKKGAALEGIAQQSGFYREHLSPLIDSGVRAYVIVSDALRYEVGVQLAEELVRDTKGSARISAVQATFPSTTKFGMAALLPHTELRLTEDLRVLCDGLRTDTTRAREEILKRQNEGNVAVSYKEIRDMKKAERRRLVAGAQAVYIYHNSIDALGDKTVTEDRVFEGCAQAIFELKNLVRVLVNDLSATHIFITADHGFLYSYKPLAESDKAEGSHVSGGVAELDRRYVIAQGKATSDHLLKLPLADWHTEYTGFTPRDAVRIKKQGGGANYVHGGLSLQECVLPVIAFRNLRSDSKDFVQTKKTTVRLLSQSRKISNEVFYLDLYQPEKASGKRIPATYELYFSDAEGRMISDRQRVIADKTEESSAERVIRVRFTLKSLALKKTESCFLTIVDKDTGDLLERIAFGVDVAFQSDWDG